MWWHFCCMLIPGFICLDNVCCGTIPSRAHSCGNGWRSLAAGTDIDATPTYPAAYTNTNIVSVIATDESDQLANYSNYGLHNSDIAAPGSKILSTVLNGQVSLQC